MGRLDNYRMKSIGCPKGEGSDRHPLDRDAAHIDRSRHRRVRRGRDPPRRQPPTSGGGMSKKGKHLDPKS